MKEFRLNAKREHLRSRIDVILGLQVYLGGFCETIGSIIMKICQNPKWHYVLKILDSMGPKYQLEKLRIISNPVDISYPIIEVEQNESLQHPLVLSMNERLQQVYPQTGFYIHHRTVRNPSLFYGEENTILLKKSDEVKDIVEESSTRTNNELRKLALNLQNELEDIKRRLNRQSDVKTSFS